MPDSLLLSCPDHGLPLIPDGGADDAATLMCPDAGCPMAVRIGAPGGLPFSPLTSLEQGAAQRHELVRAHEAAGFSRTESMQVMLCITTALIMKDPGSG